VQLNVESPFLQVRDSAGLPDRNVPLDADACDAFRAYLATRRSVGGVQHFFVNRDGRPLSTRSVQRLLRHYARAAGLEELTTQALRYQYALKAYQESQDPEAVARLLGHRHLATTIRYLRPSPAQGKE
jgi:site-specific recombinase XerD